MGIRHVFRSALSDDGLPLGIVKPSDWNADLEIDGLLGVLAALGVSANTIPYLNGSSVAQLAPLTPRGLLLLGSSDLFAIRSSLGLSIGVDVSALDSPTFTGVPTAPTASLGINSNQIATMAAVEAAITALIGGAPGALNTLNELATAINSDASFAATITAALGVRLRVDAVQGLSPTQKAQAIANLALATVAASGAYADLSGRPTLGTAAALNVGIAANQVVQLDGSAKLPAIDGSQLTGVTSTGVFTPVTTQTLTASGTYTRPAGVKWIEAWIVGGGGGGAGTNSTAASFVAGSDGAASGFNGVNANPGKGASAASSASALGGSGGTGAATRRIAGDPGGANTSQTTFSLSMGRGGNSNFAFGGAPAAINGVVAGTSAAPNTGGGGGGANSNAGSNINNAGGGSGGETAYLIINSPATTYPYTIGGGGAGGVSTVNGGNGGSGVIFVIEHYA